MFILNNLTLGSNQTAAAVLADGTTVTFVFAYHAAVQRWAVDVSYQAFAIKGKGLSTHPNLLRLYRNIIPFGLQVLTADGTDPFMPSDLAAGAGGAQARVTIVVLDDTAGQTDVQQVEAQNFAAGAVPTY